MADRGKIPMVILLILDGWGVAPAGEGNAFTGSATPNFASLTADYPFALLETGPAISGHDHPGFICERAHSALGGMGWTGDDTAPGGPSLPEYLRQAGIPVQLACEPDKCASLAHFFCGQKETKQLGIGVSVWPVKESQKAAVQAVVKARPGLLALNLSAVDRANMGGDIGQAKIAIEALDQAIGAIAKSALKRKAVLALTADHGSAEAALDMKTETPNRSRTDNPVPFLAVGREYLGKSQGWPDLPGQDLSPLKPIGTIYDIAPTVAHLFGLPKPEGWPGKNLL